MPDLVIERLFDAPPDAVYEAFVDPDLLSQWFGPVGFSVPRESIDVDAKPGGHQKLTMINDADPEQASPVEAIFDEVVPGKLLVGHEVLNEMMAEMFGTPQISLRVEFEPAGDGQTMVRIVQGPYQESFEPMARAGWHSSFVKLDIIFLRRLGMIPG